MQIPTWHVVSEQADWYCFLSDYYESLILEKIAMVISLIRSELGMNLLRAMSNFLYLSLAVYWFW